MRNMQISCLMLLLVLIACNQKQDLQPDVTDARFISQYSSSQLSVKDPFFVRFSSDVVEDAMINTTVSSEYFQISPQISGEAIWQDRKTIVFTPEKQWDYDQNYQVNLNMQNWFEEGNKNTINFMTLPVVGDVFLGELNYENDESYMLSGSIQLSDFVEHDIVEEALRIKQKSNDNLSIQWNHNDINNKHTFSISQIKRFKSESELQFNFENKGPITNLKRVKQLVVPELNAFQLMAAAKPDGVSDYIELVFSSNLKTNQNLDGLISISKSAAKFKFDIDGNTIRAYPTPFPNSDFTLVLDKSIESKSGISLPTNQEFTINVTPEKPEIKFLDKGHILPYQESVVLAFEAKALLKVDVEVFKIFDNNVLQFLQYNNLSSNSNDRSVGRIVHHETIDLKSAESNGNQGWERFAINLDQLIFADPAAVYQIRLGFKKEYTNFPCNVEFPVEEENPVEGYQTIMSGHSYYENFDYSHYKNPCYPAYYSSRNFISKNILASNLGLIVKKSGMDNLQIYATNIQTGEPRANVEIDLFDYQKQKRLSLTTNSEGMANLENAEAIYFIVANENKEYNYIHLNDGQALKTSHFEVGGTMTYKGVNGFIFGERGVWRPGDTMHLSFMLEDKEFEIPDEHPLQIKIYNARGQVHMSETTSSNIDGLYVFHVPTSASDETGNWRAEIKIGNHYFSENLKVETIKPNRLKINTGKISDTIYNIQQESVFLESRWLHGTPSAGLEARVEADYSSVDPSFKGYEKFDFSDPARKLDLTNNIVYEQALNEQGKGSYKFSFPQSELFPGNIKVNLNTRVFEKSGNFSDHYASRIIFPFSSYVGIDVPKTRWGTNYIKSDEDSSIKVVNVDVDGRPLANKNLKVGLYASEWSWWYDRSDRNMYKFNSDKHYGALDTITVTTNSRGMAEYKPKVGSGYGNYMVRICDEESGHCTGSFFYTGTWGRSSNLEMSVSKIDVNSNKGTYNVGDKVKLNFPSAKDANILISIENSKGIVESEWIESNGEQSSYSFTATQEMLPNIYVHVSMLQKWDNKNDLPIRMYGITPIKVVDEKTILKPALLSMDVFKPNATVDIKISEEEGREMAYTLAMVDEGLLDITNFRTPDPHKHFYAKQAHQIRTWDMFDGIINKMGGAIEKIISIGGDGAELVKGEKANVSRFKPVVYFDGPFLLKPGEEKTHQIKVPNYMGAVKLMVVAKRKDAYGSTDKVVPVKQELMLMTTLPRVLAPGEEISVPVNSFWTEKDVANVDLSMNIEGPVVPIDATASSYFSGQGDKMNYLSAKVSDELGPVAFNISGSANGFEAFDKTEINIRNPNPLEVKTRDTILRSGQSLEQVVKRFGTKGDQSAMVELSVIPSIGLEGRLSYLISYPYGCLEQTVSKLFPQIYLANLIKLDDVQKNEIDRNIKIGINKLRRFKRGDYFNYWRGGSYYHNWSDIYAGHFLVEAKGQGYQVDKLLLKSWLAYQNKNASNFSHSNTGSYGGDVQAYRLYVLALAGSANTSAMNRLRKSNKLTTKAKYLLAAAYGVIGQENVGRNILENIEDIDEVAYNHYSFSSSIRDRSIAALALNKLDEKDNAFRMIRQIAQELHSGSYYSTQSLAFALISLGVYADELAGEGMNYKIQLDGASRVEHTTKECIQVYDLSLIDEANFYVENLGDGPLYVNVINKGKQKPAVQKGVSKNLKMEIKYLDINKNAIDIRNLKQGTDFIAKVTITNPGTGAYQLPDLALSQVFPSGWEIRSDRVVNDSNDNSFQFQDIRDDRINTFFEIEGRKSKTYEVKLTASYAGKFYYPGTVCESMYNHNIRAQSDSQWVTVGQSTIQ